MRPLRSLVVILSAAVAGAFAQGEGIEDALLRKLDQRLSALRTRARRLSIGGALGFLACAGALVALPLVADAATAKYRALSVIAGLIMAAAGLGVIESERLVTLIDTLTDLLSHGPSMGRLDIVLAFRDQVQAQLDPEPGWAPLVKILCAAYGTTAAVRAKLEDAGIPIAQLCLNQPIVDLWRDALRAAHRRQRLGTLMTLMLEDPGISAYHEPLRACRTRLGV